MYILYVRVLEWVFCQSCLWESLDITSYIALGWLLLSHEWVLYSLGWWRYVCKLSVLHVNNMINVCSPLTFVLLIANINQSKNHLDFYDFIFTLLLEPFLFEPFGISVVLWPQLKLASDRRKITYMCSVAFWTHFHTSELPRNTHAWLINSHRPRRLSSQALP